MIYSNFSKVFEPLVQFVIACMMQMRNTILLHSPCFLSFIIQIVLCSNDEKRLDDEVKCGTH